MTSLWAARTPRPHGAAKTLDRDITADVLVIGGGMAGMLCAYLLGQGGCSCVVAEQGRVGSGVTQNTTAKVTAQHNLVYDRLIREHGPENARLYYEANQAAVAGLRQLSGTFPCDFEEKTAYVYAEGSTEGLERELVAYERLAIPHHVLPSAPVPIANKGALGMERQAQFNPLKLLYALMSTVDVYENAFVSDVSGSTAHAQGGSITADHIVFATHYPLVNIPGLYFMKLHQERSYAIALQGVPAVDGMFIGEGGGFSFRTYEDCLLVGGGGHRTGNGPGPKDGYRAIRSFADAAYPGHAECCAWATQDCMSLDGMPYIGVHRRKNPNWYVATGFSKWGMTGSYVAAKAITGLIVKGRSPVEELFSPQRSMLNGELLSNMGTSAANLVKPGKRCSHMGCSLSHNDVENSWDCPCHGSRFDENGAVVDGPATKPISMGKR
ncbi:FAD-dependent oxidoreductase [Gordonibacter massiliensis (ex Traore et al. 2017)]|uniref:FAD-dependent oxidoreductase n=1 Tax=Gordonibacter massiliensis (ex Traore et al. 2017) TaxID=1841863 RepID=UPI001C8CE390|nr:FAD-dependent oxidoreductase [Gordonibacter massiliensis (ex Traore et al. 2017)]MBX9035361.1 FAD-dependent oxidoreductase [Gordonibacter massiliensis (ex Traore et al. 2017)]